MQFKVLLKTLAGLLFILGLLFTIPLVYSALTNQLFVGLFAWLMICSTTVGVLLWFFVRKTSGEVNPRSGFAIVTFSWVLAGLVGALPYWFSDVLPNFTDALFESISGFTGCGASVLLDIESVDRSILLWRSLTQWVGGLGIILFFIAILPILGIGGVQLFRSETSGPDKDKITPRVRDTAKNLWLLYIGFTSLTAIALRIAGMNGFDAVNHAMTTLATGGFSTKNTGIAFFSSSTIDYILIVAMLLGSISFTLHYKLLIQRQFKTLLDTELKSYLIIILITTTIIAVVLHRDLGVDYHTAFRSALFTLVNTISSTGYTNFNFVTWPAVTQLILILAMFMGGMSGSTAGGMKCIRLVSAFKLLLNELKQVVHPAAYLTVKSNQHSIRRHVINSMWAFLFMYLWVFSVLVLILTFDNLDLVSASTGALSAMSNIGPAMASLGPYENYASLTVLSKLALCCGMLLGRLEFFTVLVLFTPSYWRK